MDRSRVPKNETARLCEQKFARAEPLVASIELEPYRSVVMILLSETFLNRVGVRTRDDLQTADRFGDWIEWNHALHALLAWSRHWIVVDV